MLVKLIVNALGRCCLTPTLDPTRGCTLLNYHQASKANAILEEQLLELGNKTSSVEGQLSEVRITHTQYTNTVYKTV